MEYLNGFITFEGGEGCGKSTLVASLKKYCDEHNIKSIITREPGGLKECEEIRKVLLSSPTLSPKTQVLLFSACRSHLTEQIIEPAVKDGNIVFCDRYFDSTRIYQGYCGSLNDDDIMQITRYAVGNNIPQKTFFLDLDPIVAFKRKNGADKGDVFEEKDIFFHQKLREGFNYLCKKEPQRFVKIDASQTAEEVFNEVLSILKKENIIKQ